MDTWTVYLKGPDRSNPAERNNGNRDDFRHVLFAGTLSRTQSCAFLLFLCHTAGVLAPDVADIQEYYARVCVCALSHSVLKALRCVVDSRRTPTVLIICVKQREGERGGKPAFQ